MTAVADAVRTSGNFSCEVITPCGTDPPSPELSAVAAFRAVTATLAEERDLDTVLHLIVTKLSEVTGAGRCSMRLLDRETGLQPVSSVVVCHPLTS